MQYSTLSNLQYTQIIHTNNQFNILDKVLYATIFTYYKIHIERFLIRVNIHSIQNML